MEKVKESIIMMTFIEFCSEGLTTFTPGKISSKFTDRFEMKDQSVSKCKWKMTIIFYSDISKKLYLLQMELKTDPPKRN